MSSAAPEDGLSEAFRDDKRQRSVDLGQRSVDFVVRQRSPSFFRAAFWTMCSQLIVQPGILSTINLEHNLRLIEI